MNKYKERGGSAARVPDKQCAHGTYQVLYSVTT